MRIMKDNDLPQITHADDQVMLQVARTLSAMIEQRDVALKAHCVRVANNCANFCEFNYPAVEENAEAFLRPTGSNLDN